MKKLLFIVSFLFCMSTMSAQWESTFHPADELKKTKEYTSYMYTDASGNCLIFWSNSKKNYRITCENEVFDCDVNHFISVIVGFYDENGNLKRKKKNKLHITNDNYQMADLSSMFGNSDVVTFLKEEKGYIRILVPVFRSVSPLEIRVPCMNQ